MLQKIVFFVFPFNIPFMFQYQGWLSIAFIFLSYCDLHQKSQTWNFRVLTRFKLFLNASHLKVGPVDHVEYEEEKRGEKEEESVHVVVSENIKLFFIIVE